MAFHERSSWLQAIISGAALLVYLIWVLPRLGSASVSRLDWATPMLWCGVGGLVAFVVLTVVWGAIARVREPGANASDRRDLEIDRLGTWIGQSLLVSGSAIALIITMLGGSGFWIGTVLFAGLTLSAFVAAVVRLVAYRKGF